MASAPAVCWTGPERVREAGRSDAGSATPDRTAGVDQPLDPGVAFRPGWQATLEEEERMTTTTRDRIEAVLESIRPALHADGGDVEFLSFDEKDGIVELRLLGACESCPISMLTLKEGIEQRLRRTVPEVTTVTAV